MMRPQYSSIIVEEPGFEHARSIFRMHNYEIDTLRVYRKGIRPADLQDKKGSLLYLTPSHQYPMETVMPVKTRLKVLNWARRNNAYIIEDDYESEFRYKIKPSPALQAIDRHDRVIYIGTFSKILLPSLRVAYMVMPANFPFSFRDYRYFAYTVSYQTQRALTLFMEKGYWDRHLRRMQKVYEDRYTMTVKTLKEIFGDHASFVRSDAGLSILLRVRTALSEEEMLSRAAAAGILVKGAAVTYHLRSNIPEHPEVFIGYGNLPVEKIPAIIGLLKKLWIDEA